MTVPWAPTQSPRSSSSRRRTQRRPSRPSTRTAAPAPRDARIVAKTNLPVSRSSITRPATVTSSPVSARVRRAPLAGPLRACRSGRTGTGTARPACATRRRAPDAAAFGGQPAADGLVARRFAHDGDGSRWSRRRHPEVAARARSLAASCRVRRPIWRPDPGAPCALRSSSPCSPRLRAARRCWLKLPPAGAPRWRAPRSASIPVSTTSPSSSTCRTSTARSWWRPSLLPSRRARPRRRPARLRSDCGDRARYRHARLPDGF